jgi:MFS family permease
MGLVNLHTALAFAAAALVLACIKIESTGGMIVFGVLYRFVSGSFASLGGPVVFSLTEDLRTIGTRLGMITVMCGLGLLLGNPVAGAILDRCCWYRLQVWNDRLLLVTGILLLWSRLVRFGMGFWKTV